MKIEFYKHNLTSKEIKECTKVLKSIFLTTGDVTDKFETKFAKYMEAKYAVGLSSCTDALFMSLKALGIREGDEVITTPLSFIATANAIEYCKAKPVFVDVEEETGNINADLIEKEITSKTKAILVVHLYGQMADMKKIKKIARKYSLKLIEDAAHCIEGERDGIRVGQLSDIACYSFYATKNITSGEGGAITTNSKNLYDWFIRARLHGMSKGAKDRYNKNYQHYDMEFLGYKANMTNIQASLLLNQLNYIEHFLISKEKIAKKYENQLMNIKHPQVLSNTKHGRHVFTIWVKKRLRDLTIATLQAQGIGVAVHFRPIHLMKYYKNKYRYKKGMFPVAEQIGASTITLPLYPKLKTREVNYIINAVNCATKA